MDNLQAVFICGNDLSAKFNDTVFRQFWQLRNGIEIALIYQLK
jgi:hypothetical protein